MKKRIISLILTLIMVVTSVASAPLSAHADYEDGQECWCCGHYHWDQYMCGMCGACSADCTNDSCYIKTHCNNCGNCIAEVGSYCEECNWCGDCMEEDYHCQECWECYVGDNSELCGGCWKCPDCTGDICPDCGLCEDCRDGEIHCEVCDDCPLSGIEMCEREDVWHCTDCHQVCEECDRCDIADDIEFCDICGLCIECCQDKAMEEGCDCGEYCIEDSAFQDHICEDCGTCFDAVEQCETCELCLECCENNSECSDGMCVEDPDYDEHFCEDCGACFHDETQCETCADANELRCESCCRLLAEYEGCDCGDWCINADGFQAHLKAKHAGASGSHSSATPQTMWSTDATYHWKDCKYCANTAHITNKAKHTYNKYGICTVCGFDKGRPACIIAQPKHVNCKTSDPKEDYQLNNRRTISIVARGIGNLTYQWYFNVIGGKQNIKAQNSGYCVSGATASAMTFFIPEDACDNTMQWYCVVRDSKGNTVTSEKVRVFANHNWKAANQLTKNPPRTYMHKVELTNGKTYYDYYTDGHMKACVGCGLTKARAKVEAHRFGPSQYFGKDKYGNDWTRRTCTDCGYIGYFPKHTHEYINDYGFQVNEGKSDASAHALQCLKDGCDHVTYAPHQWGAHIVQYPGNKASIKGAVGLECSDCGYWLDKIDESWTKDNYFVNAGMGGTLNKYVMKSTDTLIITPYLNNPMRKLTNAANEGKKITGWEATVKYSTSYYASGDSESRKTEDCTAKMSFTKQADGTWKVKITGSIPAGSYIYIGPKYATCTHTGGTKVVDYRAPVCNLEGYTGDTVCKDCGKMIATGVPINATDTKHTGTLTLIPGTARTGSCTVSGFTGFFRCSKCNQKVAGKNTGYKHGATTLKNYVAPTCYKEGYSGDAYCNDCGKLAKAGHTLAPAHKTTLKNYKEATYTEKGYSGDTVCTVCGYVTKQGHTTPMKESVKLTKLDITMPLPAVGDSAGAKPPFAENTLVAGGKGKVGRSYWATTSALTTPYTGTFSNTTYATTIQLKGRSGDYKLTKDTKVYVNGTLCELYPYGDDFIARYYFKPNTKITTVNINLTLPNEADDGTKAPADNLMAISSNVNITASYWTEKGLTSFKTFVGGTEYYAWFSLTPAAGYAIDASSYTTINVNGVKATAVNFGSHVLVMAPITATSIHKWNSGTVTKAASCAAGEKVFTCLNCGVTKTEEIAPVKSHGWGYESSTASSTTYKCTACGARKTEINEACDFYYSENADGVTMESYHGSDTVVYIPEKLGEKDVIAIGGGCFMFAAKTIPFEYISIPETVKTIANAAFNSCANVRFFHLPPKLETLGDTAFLGCASLEEIEFPSSLKSIGSSAFRGCTSLKNFQLPCRLESIGDGAFRDCSSITSVVIPDSVTTLEKTVFLSCTNLKTAVVGNGVTSLGLSTFGDCPNLKNVVFPESLTELQYHAFNGNPALVNVYYRGTEAQWQNVTNTENPVIDTAKKIYNFKTEYEVHHDYEEIKEIAPTAYKLGYSILKCPYCGKQKNDWYVPPTGKVGGFKCAARTAAAEKLTWSKAPVKVAGYQIQISNAAGNAWGKAYVTTANSYLFKGLSAGGNYKFRVRFFLKGPDGANYFGAWSAIASATLPAGTAVKASAGTKSFTATWAKKAVTGYQIQYATNAKFTGAKLVTIKNATTAKYVVKNLKAKTTYNVRIRTYKFINKANVFSAWSKAVKVKTK